MKHAKNTLNDWGLLGDGMDSAKKCRETLKAVKAAGK